MENLSLKEENIINGIKNQFRLKIEESCTTNEKIRNLLRLEKETKAIKDRILRDIRNLFEHEKEEVNYHNPVRGSNFWINSSIEYESNDERNKTLSVKKYLTKIRLYLKDILKLSKNLTHGKIN